MPSLSDSEARDLENTEANFLFWERTTRKGTTDLLDADALEVWLGRAIRVVTRADASELRRHHKAFESVESWCTAALAAMKERHPFDEVAAHRTIKEQQKMTVEERVERLEWAISQISQLGIRLAQMFPNSPFVLGTVDELIDRILGQSDKLAA